MYRYDPKSPKKQEKIILFALLASAAVLFAAANIPHLPYPALLQLIAVFLLVCAVMITGRCLLCRYVYSVEPRENAGEGEPLDFVVTEYQGNRMSVVCRISVADIEDIVQLTPKNRKEISQTLRKKRVYHYTARLTAKNTYLVTVRDEDEIFYLRILADQALIAALQPQQIATFVP